MNDDIPVSVLLGVLVFLLLLSAFFSASETGLMSINRYRLKNEAHKGNAAAKRVESLLKKPDRLISVILIGNNFVNIFASSIATIIALELWGEASIALASGVLTILVLIFGEITPKTFAARHPERISYPSSIVLKPLLFIFYPLVRLINGICIGLLKLLGIYASKANTDSLNSEELRTVVNEATGLIPSKHQDMLLSILDLEKITVDDIMVPRNDIMAIDIEDDLDDIINQLHATQHTRLLVYKKDINNIIGIFHMRNMSRFFSEKEFNKAILMQYVHEAYFVPAGTTLNDQLINFQQAKRRLGVVVDEYGDVLGLVTLEDILEEIVGEFTSDLAASSRDIHPQDDGSYLINGTASIRDINRALHWHLPLKGPKTLSGLIIEQLEFIPEYNLCVSLFGYKVETVQISDNLIRTVRISK
ncbi:MAG TPA: HlyC/CorC family transporter [Pseudomonadales bacterium]|nr:HlyC/CorC family transporter [Pseudomonadales bacterium]